MTEEKQAIKTLADELVKAMKSVSANTPSRYARYASNGGGGGSAGTVNASQIVGLPSALASILNALESSAAGGDAIALQILTALNHIAAGEFETITADTANIEKIYATFGDFITLVADNATIGDLNVGEIRAGLAEVGLLNVGQADIDIGQIKRLSTGTAFIREQIGGKVYIDDLAVSEANIVSLGVGQLLINNSNGELVELYVDGQGEVHTRGVTYDGDDIINANSIDGGKLHEASVNGNRLIANTITTRELNASNIFAASGTIMDLIGDNIDATRISTGSLNAGIIKTGILVDVAGKNYWNMLTGDFSLSGSTTVGGESIATTTALASAVTSINSDITDLQNQIDGNITTWFYGVDPTTSNTPAVSWNTDAKKNEHLGDLYYNTTSGYCWRWMVTGTDPNLTYSWQRITDTDVTKALANAAAAQDTADAKRRVFVTTPTPPYDVGDLWVEGSNGDIWRCSTAKASGTSYALSDWTKASKYTDDTAVTTLSNSLNQQEIFNRLTNNGVEQGIYLQNNKVYINGSYIQANSVSADVFTSATKAALVTSTSTETQYCLSTSSTTNTGSSWSTDVTWTSGKYVWKRFATTNTYANSTSSTTYQPTQTGIYDESLTKALSDAASAVTTANNAETTANAASGSVSTINSNAVARQQRIYRYRSTDTALSAYETWVTRDSATPGSANWTTTRPAYQPSYPYLFTAVQTQTISQMSGTTCSCTTPVIDRTITVISGDSITTGSIDANRILTGTLTLGGSGTPPTMTVKNSSGTVIGGWDTSGISATAGSIGGVTINSNGLYTNSKNTATSTNTGFFISNAGAIYLGAYNSTAGACPFQVTSSGVLTASSGKIANWNVQGDILYTISGSSNNYIGVGLSSDATASAAIAAGIALTTNTYEAIDGAVWWNSAKFAVKHDGTMKSTAGSIGGVTINSDGLYTNSKNTATSTNTGFFISNAGAIYLGAYNSSAGACPFQVTSSGVLTASSGKIANWNVQGNMLYTISGSSNNYIGVGLLSDATASAAIAAGITLTTNTYEAINGANWWNSAKFAVKHDGTIKATAGTVGGWTIDSDSIYSGTKAGSSTGDVRLSTTNFTRTINSTSRSDLRLAIGGNFGVTNTGKVYMANADIAGDSTFAGTLSANCITGGTLMLGGNGNSHGTLLVRDNNDTKNALQLDCDGLTGEGSYGTKFYIPSTNYPIIFHELYPNISENYYSNSIELKHDINSSTCYMTHYGASGMRTIRESNSGQNELLLDLNEIAYNYKALVNNTYQSPTRYFILNLKTHKLQWTGDVEFSTPLAITSGGTGGTTRKSAVQNLAFMEQNGGLTGTGLDTWTYWKDKGTGITWFAGVSYLNGQPSTWGFMLNIVYVDIVQQMWLPYESNAIYIRAKNSTGNMPSTWKKMTAS